MDLVKVELIPKGSHFIKKNKANQAEYFLLSGICRSFVPNQNGDLISISFFQEKSVITPHVIRTENEVSNLDFETLTGCEIATLNSKDFLDLMIRNIEIRTFANTVLQQELKQKVSKEISMASLNGKNRLLELRKIYPNIENLIPHEMIASYLGITTISLSRLRKQISTE
ncbi:MAG: Crp/Fnr family transcriptional regulator [Crocinitomix sp.]|nr:Crp/Fnr family transcriptional regulator [Crocinitomix sp.]